MRATGCWRGRRRRGRSPPTPPWPSTRTCPTSARPTGTCWPRCSWRRVLGEDAEVTDRFHGRDMLGARYEPPFPLHRQRRPSGRRGTRSCRPTSSAPRTARASCTPRSRSARTTSASGPEQGLAVINPVRADGTFDERIGPYAGRFVKDADPDLVEDLRARGRLLRAETLPARLPALLALRDAAALLRQAVVVHPHAHAARPAAGRQRDRRLAPGAHQARALRQVAGEQRRLGDLARALLGHAAAGVALRARATRSASAPSPTSRRAPGARSRTRTARTWTS